MTNVVTCAAGQPLPGTEEPGPRPEGGGRSAKSRPRVSARTLLTTARGGSTARQTGSTDMRTTELLRKPSRQVPPGGPARRRPEGCRSPAGPRRPKGKTVPKSRWIYLRRNIIMAVWKRSSRKSPSRTTNGGRKCGRTGRTPSPCKTPEWEKITSRSRLYVIPGYAGDNPHTARQYRPGHVSGPEATVFRYAAERWKT